MMCPAQTQYNSFKSQLFRRLTQQKPFYSEESAAKVVLIPVVSSSLISCCIIIPLPTLCSALFRNGTLHLLNEISPFSSNSSLLGKMVSGWANSIFGLNHLGIREACFGLNPIEALFKANCLGQKIDPLPDRKVRHSRYRTVIRGAVRSFSAATVHDGISISIWREDLFKQGWRTCRLLAGLLKFNQISFRSNSVVSNGLIAQITFSCFTFNLLGKFVSHKRKIRTRISIKCSCIYDLYLHGQAVKEEA